MTILPKTPTTKRGRYFARYRGERFIGYGFIAAVLSFLFVATSGGWESASLGRIILYFVARVGGIFAIIYGHVLLCDSKGRSRIWTLTVLFFPLGTIVLSFLSEKPFVESRTTIN